MAVGFFILALVSICQSQNIFFPTRQSTSSNQSNQKSGTNPTNQPSPSNGVCGQNAECILIARCPLLLAKALGNNAADKKAVRQAICEFSNRRMMVCCPKITVGPQPPTITTTHSESLLPRNCGKGSTDDRITGGEEAEINAYPWMVAIKYRDPFGREDFECAASVISARYLLTAAHCADPGSLGGKEIIQLNIGDYDIANPEIDCRSHQLGQICSNRAHIAAQPEEIIIHPEYSKRFRESDDIALIRIDKEIDFSADRNHITPICLPDEDFTLGSLRPDKEAIAAGWGFTENRTTSNILLRVKIPFANRDLCRARYKTLFADKQICAGGRAGRDTCSGDSGGPLIIPTTNGPPFTQIGIVSLGPQICGLENFPALYTDVAKYKQWIIDNMRP